MYHFRLYSPEAKRWLKLDKFNATADKSSAGVFTEKDFDGVRHWEGWQREPLSPDEEMQRLGEQVAPRLPGLEL